MFIYHFNRMIRNRWLWGFFAIIIVFAFVVQDMLTPKGGKGEQADAGTLGGKKVKWESFRSMAQSVRGPNSRDAVSDRTLNRLTWERLAAVQTAQELGITATDAIVAQQLAAPFTRDGIFDNAAYTRALQQQGLTSAALEHQVREEFPYHVMRNVLLQSAAWASPMEVDAATQAYLDRITAAAMTFTDPAAEKPLSLTEEDLRAYYAEHIKTFEVPDRVSVRYFAVALTNFHDRVTVTEDELMRYYEDFEDRYVKQDGTNAVQRLSYEEAKDQVRADLIKDTAPEEAKKFFNAAGIDTAMKSGLEAVAKTFGQTIKTTPLFGIDTPPPDVENGREFAETAFETDPAQAITRFATVAGASEIYFIEYISADPRHTPPFEAVRDDVNARAQAQKRRENFTAYAQKISTELGSVMLMPEMTWEKATQAAAVHGMNVSTSLTFVVSDLQALPDYPHAMQLVSTAMRQPAGAVSKAIPLDNGAMMLVFVEKREPGDMRRAEMMRSQMRSEIVQGRAMPLVEGWMAWNLSRLGLKDINESANPAPAADTPSDDPGEE